MSDLVPPPGEPMDPATRARIRSRLVEGSTAPGSPGPRRWLLPLGAAAAVLVIAFGVGYAAFSPGGDSALAPGGDPTTAPGTEPPAPTPTPTPAPTPSESSKDVDPGPTTVPSELSTLPAPTPTAGGQDGRDGCAAGVGEQVDGAEQVATWELPKGEIGIWVTGERWVLCEDSGGIATTHGSRALRSSEITRAALEFSSSTYFVDRQQMLTAYVAGGRLPEGVTGIDYLFPDGHEQRAEFRTGDDGRRWWSMGYVPYDGPMADPDTSFTDLDDVRVTVSLSGAQDEYDLVWGEDSCAQVNHGC